MIIELGTSLVLISQNEVISMCKSVMRTSENYYGKIRLESSSMAFVNHNIVIKFHLNTKNFIVTSMEKKTSLLLRRQRSTSPCHFRIEPLATRMICVPCSCQVKRRAPFRIEVGGAMCPLFTVRILYLSGGVVSGPVRGDIVLVENGQLVLGRLILNRCLGDDSGK